MVPSKKLIVFDSRRRPNLPPPDSRGTLPMIRSISGSKAGLIEMEDGSLVQVLKLNGFSVELEAEPMERVTTAFNRIIKCLTKSTRLQFLVTNRPLDVERSMNSYSNLCADDTPYLAWYADYTRKWFERVCELSMVPNREFFLVLVAEPVAGKDRKAAKQKQRSNLTRLVEKAHLIFSREGLSPSLLAKSDIRTLLYSCMRPSYASGLREEPVEHLNKSTVPNMDLEVADGYMTIDKMYVSNQVVSDLPDTIRAGWLLGLLSFSFPSSLSVHVRLGNAAQLRKGAANYPAALKRKIARLSSESQQLVEISIYFSTVADGSIETPAEEARAWFTRSNALLANDYDQRSAWISGLPLGIDSGGIAHCISMEQSRGFCPLFTASCGFKTGLPLGFAFYSREPVFLMPARSLNLYALASNDSYLKFLRSLLALRMLSTPVRLLAFSSDTGLGAQELVENLGPNLTFQLRQEDIVSSRFVSENIMEAIGDEVLLTSAHINSALNSSNLKAYKSFIASWAKRFENSSRKPAFLINLSAFKENAELLDYIYTLAKKNSMVAVTCATTSQDKRLKELCEIATQYSDIKLVSPIVPQQKSLAIELVGLPKTDEHTLKRIWKATEKEQSDLICLLRTQENHGIVRVVPSPIEYWICADHTKSQKKRLVQMKSKIQGANPKLNQTDVARQSAYYLGLEGVETETP